MTSLPNLPSAKRDYEQNPTLESADALICALTERLKSLQAKTRNEQAADETILKLANVGMALEIGGHELYRIDCKFSSAMSKLPNDLRGTPAYEELSESFEELIGGFRDLGPMQPSRSSQRWIKGKEIIHTLRTYRAHDPVHFNDAFRDMRVFGRPSEILPAIVNLVANARQWAGRDGIDPEVQVSLHDGVVYISDNGPGVAPEDIPFIFDPLFTRRRGGTGVGLYLVKNRIEKMFCSIRYIEDEAEKKLPGANFALTLIGVETEDQKAGQR